MNTDTPGQRFLFRPHERLHTRREFTRAMTEGQRFFALGIRFFYISSALPWSRLGLTVGRRLGRAVRRNRLRRLLREGYRLTRHRLPNSIDVVAMPVPSARLTLDSVRRAFAALAYEVKRKCSEEQ